MKTIVAVIVYNRFNNVEEWIRRWKMCHKEGADFILIHNYDTEEHIEPFRTLCSVNNVGYVPRRNVGMDIGAFQDVCRGRLEGFPNEWDYLFWCADDTLPMSKKFLTYYLRVMGKGSGVVCLEVSNEVKTHIRTTGFLIDQHTASLINFPADPISTKNHCYEFEHRSKDAFYEQVVRLKKSVIQVHPDLKKSYLWDTHCRANLRRRNEYHIEFPR